MMNDLAMKVMPVFLAILSWEIMDYRYGGEPAIAAAFLVLIWTGLLVWSGDLKK